MNTETITELLISNSPELSRVISELNEIREDLIAKATRNAGSVDSVVKEQTLRQLFEASVIEKCLTKILKNKYETV